MYVIAKNNYTCWFDKTKKDKGYLHNKHLEDLKKELVPWLEANQIDYKLVPSYQLKEFREREKNNGYDKDALDAYVLIQKELNEIIKKQ